MGVEQPDWPAEQDVAHARGAIGATDLAQYELGRIGLPVDRPVALSAGRPETAGYAPVARLGAKRRVTSFDTIDCRQHRLYRRVGDFAAIEA